jgi:hypothetical protein
LESEARVIGRKAERPAPYFSKRTLSVSCVSKCSSTVKVLPQTVIEPFTKALQTNCGYDFSKEPD